MSELGITGSVEVRRVGCKSPYATLTMLSLSEPVPSESFEGRDDWKEETTERKGRREGRDDLKEETA